MKKIISFFNKLVTDRSGGKNSKILCGLIGFVVLIIGLFVGVDEKLYYIFAMCDVFYFGGSVVDNWTAPTIEINKQETINKETKTETDITSIVNNAVDKIKSKNNNE